MLARPCLGCGTPVTGRRCSDCAKVAERKRHNPIYDDPRWRRLRASVLGEHRRTVGPWCPGLPPDHDAHPSWELTLDHIVPVSRGGAPFNRANVRVLCGSMNYARR